MQTPVKTIVKGFFIIIIIPRFPKALLLGLYRLTIKKRHLSWILQSSHNSSFIIVPHHKV